LKKKKKSSHKLPKQQSTKFWSQGILGVKKHFISIEGNSIYNRQFLQLRNKWFRIHGWLATTNPFKSQIIILY
jgi:hypothetical protein